MTIRWPEKVLRPQHVAFDIASRSLSGPPSISGAVQVMASDAGIWKATFGSVVIRTRDHVLAHRAIANLLEGRLGAILVPLCRAYQPLPAGADASTFEPVPHSDGAFFSEGVGYIGSANEVRLANSIAARAVTANVSIIYGGELHPGQHFSIGERLYRIRSVSYTGETTATITFRPPLRETATAGNRLEFDDPVCRMRLATDSEMDLELALRRFGNPTVNFVEDV